MKTSKRDRFIKHFYGIQGVLDEYKRAEANRIGNNAFMFLFYFELILSLGAILVATYNVTLAFYLMVGLNLLGLVYGVALYVMVASDRVFLNVYGPHGSVKWWEFHGLRYQPKTCNHPFTSRDTLWHHPYRDGQYSCKK